MVDLRSLLTTFRKKRQLLNSERNEAEPLGNPYVHRLCSPFCWRTSRIMNAALICSCDSSRAISQHYKVSETTTLALATSAGTFFAALSLPITVSALQFHDGEWPVESSIRSIKR